MRLQIGKTYVINRTITDIDNVKIELSRDNGDTWETIDSDVEIISTKVGDQQEYQPLAYRWTVTGPASVDCIFKISGLGDNTDIVDESDAPFEITADIIVSIASTANTRLTIGPNISI